MPKRFIKFLIISFCLLIIGCSTVHKQSLEDTRKPVSVLLSPTQFTFSIPRGDEVSLQLLSNRDPDVFNSYIGNIYFNDNNCTFGHQVSISYQLNERENLTFYFSKEIPWATSHTLTLNWDDLKKELIVQLNDQITTIKPNRRIRYLAIQHDTSFNFEKVEQLTP